MRSTLRELRRGGFDVLVEFLRVDYLDILTQYQMHIIFHIDIAAGAITEIGGGGRRISGSESGSASWSESSESESEESRRRRA